MNYFKQVLWGVSVSLMTLFSAPVFAVVVEWTDWQSSTATTAYGEMTINGTTIGVDYVNSAPHSFVQTGTGTNFWTGTAYTNGSVDNAPTPSELIGLNPGGTVTISFSETVTDLFFALNSWNGNTVDFGESIVFDSIGQGYFGSGVPIMNSAGTGFYGSGELHGVIALYGDYDSISFTNTSENWHGFTIASPVPEPATLALFSLGTGFVLWAGMRRRKDQKRVELPA